MIKDRYGNDTGIPEDEALINKWEAENRYAHIYKINEFEDIEPYTFYYLYIDNLVCVFRIIGIGRKHVTVIECKVYQKKVDGVTYVMRRDILDECGRILFHRYAKDPYFVDPEENRITGEGLIVYPEIIDGESVLPFEIKKDSKAYNKIKEVNPKFKPGIYYAGKATDDRFAKDTWYRLDYEIDEDIEVC